LESNRRLARVAFQIIVKIVVAAVERLAVMTLSKRALFTKSAPSFNSETGLGGGDETGGRLRRVFKQVEHQQRIAFR
jgi:hypothetical protein